MRTDSSNPQPQNEVRRHEREPSLKSREPAPATDMDQFKRWFDQRLQSDIEAGDRAAMAATTGLDEPDQRQETLQWVPAEVSALQHSYHLANGASMAATAPMVASQGLAELIEKHVHQLLVSDSARSADGRDAQVMLRLSDSVLPGTDLTLTRGVSGWELRAEVSSASASETLRECLPDLIKRFEAGGLGSLQFESVVRG